MLPKSKNVSGECYFSIGCYDFDFRLSEGDAIIQAKLEGEEVVVTVTNVPQQMEDDIVSHNRRKTR